MEKRELTQAQLQEIYALCKRKDIQYLELRMELVDHIASRIEDIWQEQPELSFKDAFHKVYKSFGIFGLSEIAEEHEKLVAKRFYRKVWVEFKSWIKPPKLIAFASLLFVFFVVMKYLPQISLGLVQANMLFALITLSLMFWKRRQLSKKLAGDQSMFMGAIYQGGIMFNLVLAGQAYHFVDFSAEAYLHFTTPIHQAFTLVLSIINILIHIVGWRFLNSVEEQLEELRQRQRFFV